MVKIQVTAAFPDVAHLWNTLPVGIRNLSTFKGLLKTYLFSKCYQTSGYGEVAP
jgi:hypothetical protein